MADIDDMLTAADFADWADLNTEETHELAVAFAEVRLSAKLEAEREIVAALEHVANGIAHARECGKFWSDDQRQAWLNGLELAARKALEGRPA